MDLILHQVGELALRAIPTFLLVIFLTLYLKYIFFRPLEKVLRRRYEATEGARRAAEQSLQHADAKTAEYEAAVRAARAEVYQQQEQVHRRLQEQAAAQIAEARAKSDAVVADAKQQIARDAAAARESLERESDLLASRIADAILGRSAA